MHQPNTNKDIIEEFRKALNLDYKQEVGGNWVDNINIPDLEEALFKALASQKKLIIKKIEEEADWDIKELGKRLTGIDTKEGAFSHGYLTAKDDFLIEINNID